MAHLSSISDSDAVSSPDSSDCSTYSYDTIAKPGSIEPALNRMTSQPRTFSRSHPREEEQPTTDGTTSESEREEDTKSHHHYHGPRHYHHHHHHHHHHPSSNSSHPPSNTHSHSSHSHRSRASSFSSRQTTNKHVNPHESRSKQPRVLVTGGAGFIGSHVARALLERGEDIVIVDELNNYYDPSIKLANLRALIDSYGHARVHTYVADICDAPAMQKCFDVEHFDRVIHLAARAGVRPSIQDPLLYERANIQGTLTLLELAKNSNGAIKHFVYASSSSVYGDEAPIPFTELDSCNVPVSPYAATKKSCELFASTYAQLHHLPCSGMRFFTVYGENGRRDMAPFIFIDRLARGLPITQFGDGTTQRDYTYVSDIVDGVLKVLDHVPGSVEMSAAVAQFSPSSQPSLHEVYNLGFGSPVPLSDFISTIAKELAVEPNIIIHPKQPGDVERTFADISKAHRLLGYVPQVSVQEGIKRTVAWYKRTQLIHAHKEEDDTIAPAPVTPAIVPNILAKFPPLPSCMCATRIHNQGSTRLGLSPDVFSHLLIWLPRALACSQYVAIAVDTSDNRRDIYDAVTKVLPGLSKEDRARVDVVCVSPWQAFVPALNALLSHAQTKQCSTILYSSLEIQMHPAHIHTLNQHLDPDTLVVGARLSGHRFVRGNAVIDGCSTIWNTLALWSVPKLSRTGFLTISDGLPERHVKDANGNTVTLPAVAGGVEEVVCVSAQQVLFPTTSRSKLLSMTAATEESWHHGSGESVESSLHPSNSLDPSLAASFATTSATSDGTDGTEESDNDEHSHTSPDQPALYDDIVTPVTTSRTLRAYSSSPPMLVSTHEPPTLNRRPSVSSALRSPIIAALAKLGSSMSTLQIVPAAAATTATHSSTSASTTSTSSPHLKQPAVVADRIPSLFWDAHFGGDVEREAAHEKKMRSKIERPQQQLREMQLQPGMVEHIHCILPSTA